MLNGRKVKTAVKHPRRALIEVEGLCRKYVFGGNDGEYVLEQDWDNLIILDACRYDLFSNINTIRGNLEKFTSRGTATGEFMRENFGGVTAQDVVYVSANPNPASVEAKFAAVKEVWDYGWDESLHTVPPEIMVDETIKAEEEYPNKRIISHFLQPHYPWIGPEGRKFMSEYGFRPGGQKENIYIMMREGQVSIDWAWECYKENLEVTMPHIERLVNELTGKTVISSDHGEAFGTMDIWGHADHAYVSELEIVPWLEAPYQKRKTIESDNSTEEMELNQEAKEHLKDLGYLGN